MKADKILVNGTIYTGLSEKPHQFLAITKNRITGIGRGAGKQYIGRNTEIIDLHGLYVTPAFTDSHLHFLDYAFSLSRVRLEDCSNEQEVLAVLEERAARAAPGEWILGRGWSKKQFRHAFPHRKILDDIFPGNPVMLNSHDEHFRWLNSAALRATHLTVPVEIPGGYVGTDPDGSPDGIIGENAIELLAPHLPEPDEATRKSTILSAQQKLHTLGIAGFHSTDANQAFGDLQDLHTEGKIRLRIFHSIPIRQLESAVEIQLRSGLGDPWFRFGFVKIFSDGALGSQTALMLEPFDGTSDTGIEIMPEAELTEKIRLALENGIACGVHAIGDRANRQVLNAFEKNSHLLVIPKARSRIEHAQLLHPQDLCRFREIGILASMQPYHAITDCEVAERFWGARAQYSYAWRSLLDAEATLIFGSDAPVENPDPILGLQAATQRENWKDKNQTISAFQALLAYTWNPVFAAGEEQDRGSLEPGKLADYVIFSDNPYRTEFKNNKVVATAIDGEFVYRDF